MQSISSLATGVSKAVWGESPAEQQSNEEPPSGATGQGTATEPFDGGNAPEQEEVNKAGAPVGSDAPSTATTAPTSSTDAATSSTATATTAPVSSTEKPTNARMPSFATKDAATGPAPDKDPALAKEAVKEEQATAAAVANPLLESSSSEAVKDNTSPDKALGGENEKKNEAYKPSSPFDPKDSSDDGSRLRADRSSHSPDRSVSPGARPDGSHAPTGKAEKHKLSSKIKEKLHIGNKH